MEFTAACKSTSSSNPVGTSEDLAKRNDEIINVVYIQSPSDKHYEISAEKKVNACLLYQPNGNFICTSYQLPIGSSSNTCLNNEKDAKILDCVEVKKTQIVSCDLANSGVIGHWKLTDKGTEYVCGMENGHCNRSFTTLSYLKNHQHIHYNKELKCTYSQCGRKFTWAHHLRYHLKSHKGEKEFKCSVAGCKAAFYTSQQRNVHLRTHTGDKPFECDLCHKNFLTSQNLQNHKRTHTGEKPFLCNYAGCSKKFAELSSLKKHLVTHTGEKPHKCSHCQKGFTQSSSLHFHHKRYHMENPPPSKSIANIQAQKIAEEAQKQQLPPEQLLANTNEPKTLSESLLEQDHGKLERNIHPTDEETIAQEYECHVSDQDADVEVSMDSSTGTRILSQKLNNPEVEDSSFILVNQNCQQLKYNINTNIVVLDQTQKISTTTVLDHTPDEHAWYQKDTSDFGISDTNGFTVKVEEFEQKDDEDYTDNFQVERSDTDVYEEAARKKCVNEAGVMSISLSKAKDMDKGFKKTLYVEIPNAHLNGKNLKKKKVESFTHKL